MRFMHFIYTLLNKIYSLCCSQDILNAQLIGSGVLGGASRKRKSAAGWLLTSQDDTLRRDQKEET